MEMERIVGLLFSGFMVRLYAAVLACTVAYKVGSKVIELFHTIPHGLPMGH